MIDSNPQYQFVSLTKIGRRRLAILLLVLTISTFWMDGLSIRIAGATLTASSILSAVFVCFWFALFLGRVSSSLAFNAFIPRKVRFIFFLSIVYILIGLSGIFKSSPGHDEIFRNITRDIFVVFFAICAVDVARREFRHYHLFYILCITTLLSATVLIESAINPGVRPTGVVSFGAPNYAANRILPLVIICFVLATNKSEKRAYQFSYFGMLVINSMSLLSTGSSAATLSAVFACVLYVILQRPAFLFRNLSKIFPIFLIGIFLIDTSTIPERISRGMEAAQAGERVRDGASINERLERDAESISRIEAVSANRVGARA